MQADAVENSSIEGTWYFIENDLFMEKSFLLKITFGLMMKVAEKYL